MHLNADVVRVEILGPDGQPVPPGVEGDVVVTSLLNVAMPMIRFRIEDRGWLTEDACRCGVALPRLGVVTGRVAEVLEVGGQRLSPYVFTSALEKVAGLVRYQVLQIAPTRFAVRSVLASDASPEAVSADIRKVIAEAVGHPIDVEVELVDRLGQGPGRKTRVVQPLTSAGQEDHA
jgi:phenylacetate-CoA ligase